MDVVGSEIGQKMRSAIKAKLTELGCYVDDELPDYVMVMVANKRTRAQMEDDLQLFLGDNTELFVNWLHQVLKKLQEVTVTPLKPTEMDKSKEKSLSKEQKPKEKKVKKDSTKKTKKKDKEKSHRKKEDKKLHKKKKSKHHEMIHPNVPPLLMNMEKVSEPSITDVFAGQILKNYGIITDTPIDDPKEQKPVSKETKRPILPIIDPATIPSQTDLASSSTDINNTSESNPQEETLEGPNKAKKSLLLNRKINMVSVDPKDDKIKEMNEIEAKIQGLKNKLAEQLDSMSDDDDFLNIRTEAEELMNDFAEDVFQEISSQAPATPPLTICKSPSPKSSEIPKEPPKDIPETLPQIELNLPKRPIRERLGAREEQKTMPEIKENEDKDKRAKEKKDKLVKDKEEKDKRENEKRENKADSSERFTPDNEPEVRPKSAKSRLGDLLEREKKSSLSEDSSDKSDSSSKRLTSKVWVCEGRAAGTSVGRVRPRPRVASASSLLLRAVADAHKSLLNIPPKVEHESQKVKRALVLPMRRCVDTQKIVIQIPTNSEHESGSTAVSDIGTDKKSSKSLNKDKEEYVPTPLTKKFTNTDYVPSRRKENRISTRKDDTLIIETINIHNTTVDKQKDTQFIVTMDGFNPNAFLAKKLKTEGLIDDEEEILTKTNKSVLKSQVTEKQEKTEVINEKDKTKDKDIDRLETIQEKTDPAKDNDRICLNEESNMCVSDVQIVVKKEVNEAEKRKSTDETSTDSKDTVDLKEESPPSKKRKASPIVFDVNKKERKERERTESASSDNHVTVTTTTSSSKYDALPPLIVERRAPCRAFPQCRFGAACLFAHPRCKFAASCTRRNCVYSHADRPPPAPLASPAPLSSPLPLSSHVVPAANYKSISTALPNMCKYYPNCANPGCHYYHPKLCRYGKACLNKLECNFYHSDLPTAKWRYPV